jgi:hypothetical protein
LSEQAQPRTEVINVRRADGGEIGPRRASQITATSENWRKRLGVGWHLEDSAGEGREEGHRQQLLKKGLLEPEVAAAQYDLQLSLSFIGIV